MTKSFEEFEVYKKGVQLAKLTFELMNNKPFEREFGFKDQIKRAVLSITNNIAEGSEYNNNKQLIRYLKISKGSCAEVRSILILSRELGFCNQQEIQKGYDLTIEISQNLSNFIKYLNTKIES
ncbi:four helix bundle protein [Flavobacterium sp. LM4]|uniref:four helix bundle protein n=1 Tax=Flavobacterium sp. LM4 TaxID=1938609 RepID=UPI000993E60C|nr:four helix bundle protein [Flavobacterium sp. LM4]OOV18874.1 four helix bundle protein [Flavobacterium sp. LM4]